MIHIRWIQQMLILGMLMAGCSRENTIPPTPDIPAIYTAAAETAQTLVTKQPTSEATSPPTSVPSPTAELATNTPGQITPTPLGAAPSNGVTPVNTCDIAGFVADITIPDGTPLAPGAVFIKTWELSNDGTCTWNANYEIVYSSGAQMDAPAVQTITPGNVAPGETLKISLEMVAPAETGQHIGYWILRSDTGQYFGIGTELGALYVDITVVTITETVSATNTSENETPTSTREPSITPTFTESPSPSPQPDETSSEN